MINADRRAELERGLERVRERIAVACGAVGRDPAEITLIAVTKTYPASDVVLLCQLGVRDIGENRDQEAFGKAAQVSAAGAQVRWHFVGQLQRNKCRSVARYAHTVHSVDRLPLVSALGGAAGAAGRAVNVLLQVSLDDDPSRGGLRADDLASVADAVAEQPALRLRGVMAVAPMDGDPGAAFARLAEISVRLRTAHPDASEISAGMSGDLDAAIAHGATQVRIGSALLGKRVLLG